eukprot:158984-Pelagomonas_calceolata.AAC.1
MQQARCHTLSIQTQLCELRRRADSTRDTDEPTWACMDCACGRQPHDAMSERTAAAHSPALAF